MEQLDITTKKSIKNLNFDHQFNSEESSPLVSAKSSVYKLEQGKNDASIISSKFIPFISGLQTLDSEEENQFIQSIFLDITDFSIPMNSILLNNISFLIQDDNMLRSKVWDVIFEKIGR